MKIKADAAFGFVLCHSLAVLALFPWFFSWSGVILFAIAVNVFGVIGLNLGFHRLLTHRGFTCPLWLEHTVAILGTCSLEFSPALWVAAGTTIMPTMSPTRIRRSRALSGRISAGC
jgi:fatty-acid desaturase